MEDTNPIIIKSAFNVSNQQNQYEGKVQSFTPAKGLYASPLGTPVMQDLTFGSVTYTDKRTMQQKKTKQITLINILLAASQSKKIVKTEIQGLAGTIKEFIGEDDWQITINGFLVAGNGQSPTAHIIALKELASVNKYSLEPVSIPVVCTWLNNLDIFNIVIEDFAMEQDPGGRAKQAFTITAISDQDILLQIF